MEKKLSKEYSSCEDYVNSSLRVKPLLQICGHLRFGERLLRVREYGAATKHKTIVQSKRRECNACVIIVKISHIF